MEEKREMETDRLEDMEVTYRKLQSMEEEMERKYALEMSYLDQAMHDTKDPKTQRLLEESREAIKHFNIGCQEMVTRMGGEIERRRYEEEQNENEELNSQR